MTFFLSMFRFFLIISYFLSKKKNRIPNSIYRLKFVFYLRLLLSFLYQPLPHYLSALLPLLTSRRFDYLLTLGASVLPATVVCVSFVTVISWEILLITFFKDVLDETACSLLLCTTFIRCFSIKIKMIYYIILYFYLSRQ